MRTFDRDTFLRARAEWEQGNFGPAWEPFRRLAAERGFIFPPVGTPNDDRDDENPSQRAIVWRCLEDNPAELRRIIGRSSSWSAVVNAIIGLEDRLREDVRDGERDAEWEKAQQPTSREASAAIASTFERVAASLGYVKAGER